MALPVMCVGFARQAGGAVRTAAFGAPAAHGRILSALHAGAFVAAALYVAAPLVAARFIAPGAAARDRPARRPATSPAGTGECPGGA